MSHKPTDEQTTIIDAAATGEDLVIEPEQEPALTAGEAFAERLHDELAEPDPAEAETGATACPVTGGCILCRPGRVAEWPEPTTAVGPTALRAEYARQRAQGRDSVESLARTLIGIPDGV